MKKTVNQFAGWITLDDAKAAAKKYLPDCRLETCIRHYLLFCDAVIKSETGTNKDRYIKHKQLLSLITITDSQRN